MCNVYLHKRVCFNNWFGQSPGVLPNVLPKTKHNSASKRKPLGFFIKKYVEHKR